MDTLKSYDYYIEFYEDTEIIIEGSEASNVVEDERGNEITGEINAGINFMMPKSKTYTGNIILYTDDNFNYYPDSTPFDEGMEEGRFLIRGNKDIYYDTGVDRLIGVQDVQDKNKFSADLLNKTPIKVIANGIEVTSYTYTTTDLTISPADENLVDGINDFVLIYANDGSAFSGNVIFNYQAPNEIIPNLESLEDGSYFQGENILKICEFTSINVNKGKEIYNVRQKDRYTKYNREVDRDYQITFNFYKDYRDMLKGKRFRILAWDRRSKKVKIFNNCIYHETENFGLEFSRGNYNLNINFEDEVNIGYNEDPDVPEFFTHIYAGGQTTQTVRVYDKSTLDYIGETPDYDGWVLSIALDNNYIYAGGRTTQTVRVYDKSTLDYIGETADYGGLIYSIAVDDNHIYVGGNTQTVRVYDKSTLDYIGETSDYGGNIQSVAVDDNHIYAGGDSTRTVRVYDKSTLDYIGQTADYGGTILSIKLDNNYIYAGGTVTQTVRVYDKSTLDYIGETAKYGGNIWSITVDDNYIYAGGSTTQTVRVYDKSTFAYTGETASYGGVIWTIAIDDNYIYAGGSTTQTVRVYDKSTLDYIGETANYGGNIRAVALG